MSKRTKKIVERDRRRSVESQAVAPVSTGASTPSKSYMPSQAAFRELIESVVIAFVLAFLFRTFEAEAFVIPTGSMATTLMGRHKDVICPECGYNYQVGASEEVDQVTGALIPGKDVTGGTCPMCRYTDHRLQREPSFNGDRILVGKFLYQYEDPERFDVAVFKFPGEAKINYIKRVTGLPGETIRIAHGDLFVKRADEADFQIARKSPHKLLAMLKPVYDNDCVMPEKLLAKGWPDRWQSAADAGGWQTSQDHLSFSSDGSQAAWLRYRHFVPDNRVWDAISRDASPSNFRPEPQLISDFCAYNTTLDRSTEGHDGQRLGLHWVGDLAVECALDVRAAAGQVVFELVEGGCPMQCRIDLATGEAVLSISGETLARAGKTPITKPGNYKIRFANADDQLRLWVNEKVVEFDGETTYRPSDPCKPGQADLSPVGIAAPGANVQIAHLKVLRDVYYIADRAGSISDFDNPEAYFSRFDPRGAVDRGIAFVLSHPEKYDTSRMQIVEFKLDKDRFLVLGDNSPRSKDSRLWGPEYWVDRDLLVGKALYVYWPHSWDKVTIGGATIPFPFFPNFERMELVR